MSILITDIHKATNEEWDEIWQECDYSTYFHSREWAEIWNVYTKGKMHPSPILITFSDDKKALLPLSYEKKFKGLIKNFISSPAGNYGGWLSVDTLDIRHAEILTDYLIKNFNNLSWRLNPYDKLVSQTNLKISEDDETHTLNLTCGFEEVYRKGTKRNRYSARKAGKAGVSVHIASILDEWHSYYEVYKDSLRRWGRKASSRYKWGIFKEIFQRNSSNVKLWLSIYQDKIICGVLCFYAKKHIVAWHSSTLEKYFNLCPVNFLMYEIIKKGCEEKFTWFDFNPSGGHEGVKTFKNRFGPEILHCPIIKAETKCVEIIRNLLKK